MNDREMLELAAKAAGRGNRWWIGDARLKWNPLTDDGDALRLAVRLMMYLNIDGMEIGYRVGYVLHTEIISIQDGDVPASIRRAITRAAAEIALRKLAGT